MKTTIQEQDGKMVAILAGSLDTAAAPETEKAMSTLNDVEGKDVIIDCTELEYISSAGLRIFLGILQNVEEKGGHVYIKGINENVRTIFTITGFSMGRVILRVCCHLPAPSIMAASYIDASIPLMEAR